MTPDQYRREGAEAMRVKAAKLVDWPALKLKAQMGNDFDKGYFEALEAVRAIDPAEVLAGMPPTHDPVARLVEAAKNASRAWFADDLNTGLMMTALDKALAAMETYHDH